MARSAEKTCPKCGTKNAPYRDACWVCFTLLERSSQRTEGLYDGVEDVSGSPSNAVIGFLALGCIFVGILHELPIVKAVLGATLFLLPFVALYYVSKMSIDESAPLFDRIAKSVVKAGLILALVPVIGAFVIGLACAAGCHGEVRVFCR